MCLLTYIALLHRHLTAKASQSSCRHRRLTLVKLRVGARFSDVGSIVGNGLIDQPSLVTSTGSTYITCNVLSTMSATTPEQQPDKGTSSPVPKDVLLIVFVHGCEPHDMPSTECSLNLVGSKERNRLSRTFPRDSSTSYQKARAIFPSSALSFLPMRSISITSPMRKH